MTQNIDKLVAEVFDPEKVLLHCEDHHYFAKDTSTVPKHPCQKCWMCYYTLLIGKSDPSRRQEKIERLDEIVKKMAEQIGRGEDPGRLIGPARIDPKKAN